MGHESGEFGAVFGGDVVEAAVDGTAEFGEVVVVATVGHVAFDELPQAFDQIAGSGNTTGSQGSVPRQPSPSRACSQQNSMTFICQ